MKLTKANELLERLQGKKGANLQYLLDWWGKGSINEAIRTVFARKSANADQFARATGVQDQVLRLTYSL